MGKKTRRFKVMNSSSDSRKANKTNNDVKSKSAKNIASSEPVYESKAWQQDKMENRLEDGKNREDQLLTGGWETRYAS